jgi:hypothetical protein
VAVSSLGPGSYRRGRPGEMIYDLPARLDIGDVSFIAPGVVSNVAPLQKALAEVQHGLDRQGKIIPKIAKSQHITVRDLTGQRALGETEYPADNIEISPKVCSTINDLAPAEKTVKQREGFWPPTDPDVSLADLIVAHEMGHVVADHVTQADMEAMWPKLAKILGVPPPGRTLDPGTRQWGTDPGWATGYAHEIAPQVSKYGTYSTQELQGELWAEYTSSSHPRPPAKFYGDYVLAHLSEKQVITG